MFVDCVQSVTALCVLQCQATADQKAKEVTCWLVQAYDELLEGWDSTEGESYSERYHVRLQLHPVRTHYAETFLSIIALLC